MNFLDVLSEIEVRVDNIVNISCTELRKMDDEDHQHHPATIVVVVRAAGCLAKTHLRQ